MNNYLITVVGATAIGKTALSILLATHFKAEIISCDSRQFYKEMEIGTAVPSKSELAAAKHHFIQDRSIFDDYSVGSFEKDALKTLQQLYTTHPIAIMVGGSGLYANAVIEGLDYFPDIDPAIRTQLTTDLEQYGLPYLQEKLKNLDIESYQTLEIENPHRVIRALEICLGTGKSYASFKNKEKNKRFFKTIKIGLTAPREFMYDRINKRVDSMMENGLLNEAEKLYPHKHLNALQTVGYKELFCYFDGDYTLPFAIDEIKKNTRRFAKRQVTWNKKDTEINWFQYNENPLTIINFIEQLIKSDA